MVNLWEHLNFFDKNGKYLNFDYDSENDVWSGDIYLPMVSTGLYEVGQLFILQEFIDSNTGTKKFGYPHDTEISGTGEGGWIVQWKDTTPDEIFLFQFEADFAEPCDTEDPEPLISIYDSIDVDLDYDSSDVYPVPPGSLLLQSGGYLLLQSGGKILLEESTDGFVKSSSINSEVLTINFAINSRYENTYKRALQIVDKSTGKLVAEFMVYGETVEEDERLKVMTQNFGYQVLAQDSTIFKETDINEILPDWQEVNLKRKEMMLEAQNIYTFLGSYKGLVNAIKFFGYNNLTIKEYWKNVDKTSPRFGKYIHSNPIGAFDPVVNYNDNSIELPNKKFRKTSLFSLIYRINKITPNSFDIEDLPNTEEVFDYSIEEVLIKLYGLKRKLEKDFLPLNAHIKDIIGEADYFGLQEVTNTISRNDANSIVAGIAADFDYSPKGCNLIQDLRDINCLLFPETTGFCPYPQNLVLGPYDETGGNSDIPLPPIGPDPYGVLGQPVDASQYTVSELADQYLAYFSRYAPNINTLDWNDGLSSHRLPDKPGIPVGAPIVLENTSFGQLTWDDVNSNWNELDNGVYFTFDFEPVNPGLNDVFYITDPVTGTGASYIVQAGDTAQTVRDELFNQLETLKNNFQVPWIFYIITSENTSSGPAVRLWGSDLNQLEFGVNKTPFSNAELKREELPGTLLFTWDSILRGNYQEIEWTIFKDADDSPEYFYRIRGPIDDYDKLPIVLPYVGNYTVEMKLFDLFNNISSLVKIDEVCVEGREVDFLGWYQSRECEYSWNSEGDFNWKDYGAYWDLPIPPETTWETEQASLYESLNRVNAILNNFGVGTNPNFSIMNYQATDAVSFRGPYFWDNLDKGNWNDTCHLWWDMTSTTGDTPAFFQFAEVIPNSYLQITDLSGNVGEHYFDSSTTTLREAVNQLNLSTDPIINKYIYNLVLDAAESQIFVQAVARYFGFYGDFQSVDIVDTQGDRICANENTGNPSVATGCESIIFRSGGHVASNPTWNTAKFVIDGKVLPRMTWLMFVYDNCKISGKDKPRWTIKNTTDPKSSNIYYESKYLTYLFKDKGKYAITLELEDTNGNKYTKEKNILIIK
jgi:hypothetical protein